MIHLFWPRDVTSEAPSVDVCLELLDRYFVPSLEKASNKVICGDNFEVMRALLPTYRSRFDFIYFDPPFNTGREFKKSIHLRTRPQIHFPAAQPEFRDTWDDSAYCRFVFERLSVAKVLLAPRGSIVIHCDFNAQHLIRLMANEVFGTRNFRNQIIWKFASAPPIALTYGPSHDMLFWYTQSDEWTFQPRSSRASDGDHDSAIIGTDDVWDDPSTQKHWSDLDGVGSGKMEGDQYVYPTQKPLRFLEQLVASHTGPDDLILDAFGGSGSLSVAAVALGRRFVSIDVNPRSVYITTRRLLRWLHCRGEETWHHTRGFETLSLKYAGRTGASVATRRAIQAADLDVTVHCGWLTIRGFRPHRLLDRLYGELGPQVARSIGWQSLIDGVLIDWVCEGEIFKPTTLDLPALGDLIEGAYLRPSDSKIARVRLYDVAGDAWEWQLEL